MLSKINQPTCNWWNKSASGVLKEGRLLNLWPSQAIMAKRQDSCLFQGYSRKVYITNAIETGFSNFLLWAGIHYITLCIPWRRVYRREKLKGKEKTKLQAMYVGRFSFIWRVKSSEFLFIFLPSNSDIINTKNLIK